MLVAVVFECYSLILLLVNDTMVTWSQLPVTSKCVHVIYPESILDRSLTLGLVQSHSAQFKEFPRPATSLRARLAFTLMKQYLESSNSTISPTLPVRHTYISYETLLISNTVVTCSIIL